MRSAPGENVVFVEDMSEVGSKVEELIEKREGKQYCMVCDYSTWKTSHIKDHVEVHINGLAYSCQFCDKTFRSRNILRYICLLLKEEQNLGKEQTNLKFFQEQDAR